MVNTPAGVERPLPPLLMLERPIRTPLRYTCIVCCGRLTRIITGPLGESSGCHQYSPGFKGPVGFPVGVPLVWKEGRSIANEVARRTAERTIVDPSFIICSPAAIVQIDEQL